MDYGKFKYESAVKARESRKNQTQTIVKEIKLRPKIDPHDYGTKKGHVERFLKAGDKVKVTIMFRGREQSRPELGFRLLQRLAGDVEELGFVEATPKQDGRNMIMVIGPHKKKSETKVHTAAKPVPNPRSAASHDAEAVPDAEAPQAAEALQDSEALQHSEALQDSAIPQDSEAQQDSAVPQAADDAAEPVEQAADEAARTQA
jgi:translation initiation factor IF-3